jgi:hypothetical protein
MLVSHANGQLRKSDLEVKKSIITEVPKLSATEEGRPEDCTHSSTGRQDLHRDTR